MKNYKRTIEQLIIKLEELCPLVAELKDSEAGHLVRKLESLCPLATELKELEAEHKQVSEKLKTQALVLENMVEGVNVTDENANIFFTNEAFDKMFGYERGELLDKHVSILNAYPDEENARIIKEIIEHLRAKGAWFGEFYNRKKDHTTFFTRARISALEVSGKKYWITVQEDITERKRMEKELVLYQKQLRALTSELSLAEERERRRIAADLHDRIGQVLAISRFKLGELKKLAAGSNFVRQLKDVQDAINEAINDTRSLIFELSPPILHELGFEAAVEWLAEHCHQQYGILVNFEDDKQPKPLDKDMQFFLFKAVRELLINVAKHSQAHNAKIFICRDADTVKIVVEDDGVGLNLSECDIVTGKIDGFGLFTIRERLDYHGGHFKLESLPGHGTRVTLEVIRKNGKTLDKPFTSC